MMRLRLGGLLALILLGISCSMAYMQPERWEFRQRQMGVTARIVLYAPNEPAATRAASAAFERIAALDSILSDYRPTSELMRLSAGAGGPPIPLSDNLFHILSRAQVLARLSDGAFDVTAGPLVRLWREARRTGVLPSPAARGEAATRVGWRLVQLDSTARTAHLLAPGMLLDLGGIAKGYAADEALATLRESGIERALIELGGDIVASGPPPGQRGWRVQIANAPPGRASILLAHAAVSTSGDTEQFVEIGGERFSHVLDPRTGMGLRSRTAATVIAPDGTTADGLSTLLTVLGPEHGQAFIDQHFPAVTAYVRRVDEVSSRSPSPGGGGSALHGRFGTGTPMPGRGIGKLAESRFGEHIGVGASIGCRHPAPDPRSRPSWQGGSQPLTRAAFPPAALPISRSGRIPWQLQQGPVPRPRHTRSTRDASFWEAASL